ncbi:AAA family ATPase [Nonomuraea terrae]|uniref:MinD/ParA family ATP-binding protein n=1 Tax=Nonomuraea terrae TaxID=2530383 RepID=UPI00379F34DD
MARHDREESLEEQLAWLDAIKETEETTPVSVGASSASADEPVASPYPKDPWRLVTPPETPPPPLFRAAADSVHDTAQDPAHETGHQTVHATGHETVHATGRDAGDDVAEDADETRAVARDELPPRSSSDDAFLAPLKPLPRPDDTDTYRLSFTPPKPAAEQPEDAAEAPPSWFGDEPARADEEPSGDDGERSSRDEIQPRVPQWPEQPEPEQERPAEPSQPPQWAEASETLPRTDLPHWPGAAAPEPESRERSPWPEPPQERPRWSSPEASPQWTGPQERPEWTGPQGGTDWTGPQERPEPMEAQERPRPVESLEPTESSERPHERPHEGPGERLHEGPGERLHERPAERPQASERPRPGERPQASEQPEWRPADRDIPPTPPRHRPAPVHVFNAPPRPPVTGRPTVDSLDPDTLLRGRRNAPAKGWRRMVYKASGGWIKPGEPPEVRRRRELITRARTPVTTGHHRVAVLSLKGGVGKTTTTVGLGATLAQVRGDRVIAVDANPDRGTLSDKLALETSATVRDLLNEREQVKRYVDIRAFTSQAPSRLEVLASDRDPSVSEAFSGSDYQAVAEVLENFYSICLTDCGTGLLHSAMGGVLGMADQIVLVSSPSVDGARAASATLDWLEAHHYGDLVKNATVVLCSVRPRSKSAVDIKKLEAHFAARCRAVVRVPYDPHLEEGAEIDLDRLQEATRDAYLQLAASVGDGFTALRE